MMRSFVLIAALFLCSLSWNSVSGSEFQTMEVQPGEEVTLQCSKIKDIRSRDLIVRGWFRVINKTKPSCISSVVEFSTETSFCHGFENGLFEMSSNVSSVFLKIKEVKLSDAGLYFCGFYARTHTVFSPAIELRIQSGDSNDGEDFKSEREADKMIHLMSIILGGLTGLLTIVVIILVLKLRKLQTAVHEELQLEGSKNMSQDDLNYAALSFKRSRKSATHRELEPHVVYAATR
ncbi:uncharacterized protein LOC115797297 [Archocentrus centrarchus]|uniref:uncharacterized protein LOC115797297 n=1 Tax=Archocentrus centrarchus TaxID=63155 RepID=UPI0011EA4A8A|nr:uncharacterized protein LOC115797297 [Archocentrus centrarchus]XP_030609696.1 uncharacterized protein LOC115797297 [Archocentrus centrarchus]